MLWMSPMYGLSLQSTSKASPPFSFLPISLLRGAFLLSLLPFIESWLCLSVLCHIFVVSRWKDWNSDREWGWPKYIVLCKFSVVLALEKYISTTLGVLSQWYICMLPNSNCHIRVPELQIWTRAISNSYYLFCLHVCISTVYMPGAYRDQKWVLNHLKGVIGSCDLPFKC